VTSRRWEPRRNPEDTNVGEQGTSYFGVFRATHVGLDSMELTVLLERMKMESQGRTRHRERLRSRERQAFRMAPEHCVTQRT